MQEPSGYGFRGDGRGGESAASSGPDVSFGDLISVDVAPGRVQERDADFAAPRWWPTWAEPRLDTGGLVQRDPAEHPVHVGCYGSPS